MSIEITDWLRGLGLEQYATVFRDNDMDDDLLWRLTAEDLRELGIASIGHRRRLLVSWSRHRHPPTQMTRHAIAQIALNGNP